MTRVISTRRRRSSAYQSAENYRRDQPHMTDGSRLSGAETSSMVSSLRRLVQTSRRSRPSAFAAPSVATGQIRHRHPAMAGLNVPPVHGHHCICDRCVRNAQTSR
jgi:hypothetical protein